MKHFFIRFLIALFLCKASFAGFDTADTKFDITSVGQKKIKLLIHQNNNKILEQIIDTTTTNLPKNSLYQLDKQQDGIILSYFVESDNPLLMLIDYDGNIFLKYLQATSYSLRRSLGIKTFSNITNDGNLSYYQLYLHAKNFHNLGLLKTFTGEFTQDYLFNRGVMHFGDTEPFAERACYRDYLINDISDARPSYEYGVIDDYGAIIAENGLRIEGLCHRSHGLVDISGELALKQASIENHGAYNVERTITGQVDKIINHNNFDVGYLSNDNLKVNHFSNFQNFVAHDNYNLITEESFNNQGAIFAKNNAIVGSRKKVESVGSILAEGLIKTAIDEAVDSATLEATLKNVNPTSKRKIKHVRTKITEYFLNTITDHYNVNQYGSMFSHRTETGYIFQKRTIDKKEEEHELNNFNDQVADHYNKQLQKREFLNSVKNHLKDNLKRLGAIHGNRSSLMSALINGLQGAGLSEDDINFILDDNDLSETLSSIAALDYIESNPTAVQQMYNAGLSSLSNLAVRCLIKDYNLPQSSYTTYAPQLTKQLQGQMDHNIKNKKMNMPNAFCQVLKEVEGNLSKLNPPVQNVNFILNSLNNPLTKEIGKYLFKRSLDSLREFLTQAVTNHKQLIDLWKAGNILYKDSSNIGQKQLSNSKSSSGGAGNIDPDDEKGKSSNSFGVQVPSKTLWNSKSDHRIRIDVENPAPGRRLGQIHYQDAKGNKYIYNQKTQQFDGAPNSVNKMIKDDNDFKNAIEKGLKYLK